MALRIPFPIGKRFIYPYGESQSDLSHLHLRPATMEDMEFLQQLYYQTREEELAAVPWAPLEKKAFLDSQFDLQHHHYVSHYANTDFLLIEHQSNPIGRFYLQQQTDFFLIVDISLLTAWRNRGIGSALIRYSQNLAKAINGTLNLHVEQRNHAAYRLYTRLGFACDQAEGMHLKMHWQAA